MARDHARIMLAIWGDDDFKALTCAAQRMYFVLLSQPNLRHCGSLDYLPSRLTGLAADETLPKVQSAVEQLTRSKHVIADHDTAELLLRTYVRHDGLLGSPNMVKAMLKDRSHVISDTLRDALDNELAKAFRAEPRAAGWKGFKAADPTLFQKVSAKGSAKGSRKG